MAETGIKAQGAPQRPIRAGGKTRVPFTDLAPMANEIWASIEKDYLASLLGGRYIGGTAVADFERDWAAYCGTDCAVGVANGTDALELTLVALGIGPGDEVIVPANTFIATAAAVVRAGAVPASPTSATTRC